MCTITLRRMGNKTHSSYPSSLGHEAEVPQFIVLPETWNDLFEIMHNVDLDDTVQAQLLFCRG